MFHDYYPSVISGGKVVIPAELRRELGIENGDSLVFTRREGGGLGLYTFDHMIPDSQRRAREIFGAHYTVDQFVAENSADWGAE